MRRQPYARVPFVRFLFQRASGENKIHCCCGHEPQRREHVHTASIGVRARRRRNGGQCASAGFVRKKTVRKTHGGPQAYNPVRQTTTIRELVKGLSRDYDSTAVRLSGRHAHDRLVSGEFARHPSEQQRRNTSVWERQPGRRTYRTARRRRCLASARCARASSTRAACRER